MTTFVSQLHEANSRPETTTSSQHVDDRQNSSVYNTQSCVMDHKSCWPTPTATHYKLHICVDDKNISSTNLHALVDSIQQEMPTY